MGKRTPATAETRRRIVEATVDLHGKKGIFGTSWQDIARKADVSIGTVYKHFPTLEDLMPACGEMLMERIRPPAPEDAPAIIGEAADPEARLRHIASELFAFYERGGPHLETDLRERELPAIRQWEDEMRTLVSHFVGEALSDLRLDEQRLAVVGALFDLPAFKAFRLRGIGVEEAADHAVDLAMSWLDRASQKSG